MELKKWQKLSLAQQFGNIVSEFSRAKHWEKKGDFYSRSQALERSLALIDLTIRHRHLSPSLKEIVRLREVIGDLLVNTHQYDINIDNLIRICMPFAFLARRRQ